MPVSEINNFFTDEVITKIKNHIDECGGNEVFFTGKIDLKGVVVSVEACARGNEHSVPVNFSEARSCDVLIHNHPSGKLIPSNADISVASQASEKAQGFYIINNLVTDVYVVVNPVKPKSIEKIDEEEAAFYISEGGPLSRDSENFEERKVQIELLKKISSSFNNNSIGVFEAGTGVGKSYAYLIPSILWAQKNKERIVISTGTINLQQQLCEKDIPFGLKITGSDVKFLLMKGRQNYICKRRLEEVTAQKELFEEDFEILDKIREWSLSSPSGSKSELPFMAPLGVWSKVCSESDSCMGMRCPFHTECFVMKVKKEAATANILVVNHHLLFADIESRMHGAGYDDAAVLPPYKNIIFDEAHGIESAATSFFSQAFNRFNILKQLNLLYRKRKGSESGYICTVSILSSTGENCTFAYEKISKIKNDIINLETCGLDLLGSYYTLRLSDENARGFGPLISLCSTLANSISDFVGLCRNIMDGVHDEDKSVPAYFQAKILLRRLEDYSLVLKDFCSWDEKRDQVFWLQKKVLSKDFEKDGDNALMLVINETPLDIAPLMNNGVFEPMNTVVCTSATLKTGRDFGYFMRRTGVSFCDPERVMFGEFPSPFPYKKNMLFAVPKDAPLPDDVNFQGWVDAAISELVSASEGKTLVLFTSYDSLKSSYNNCIRSLRHISGAILRQGMDDNARLLDTFKKDVNSVLFATDSFWQGVDVPGEALSQVIIVKLPFAVPNDPVFTARSELISKRGGSPFMELSVPEALIKFRQGIGRLMRRSTDRGAVVVLDRRVYEKKYGAMFLNSLPECKRIYDSLSAISNSISEHIFN